MTWKRVLLAAHSGEEPAVAREKAGDCQLFVTSSAHGERLLDAVCVQQAIARHRIVGS